MVGGAEERGKEGRLNVIRRALFPRVFILGSGCRRDAISLKFVG